MQVPEELSGLLSNTAWNVPGHLSGLQEQASSGDPGGSVPAAAAVYSQAQEEGTEGTSALDRKQLLEALGQEPVSRTVHLKTTYISGEEIVTLPGTSPSSSLGRSSLHIRAGTAGSAQTGISGWSVWSTTYRR
ncbi:hypothetical protein JI735_01575 [Paenibacillus sonchi]|uniref:Uncharacterized protein n=2 Tax=Paenibacillus sonchi TaxID=373687 RepID=A0A974PCJ9_9BACL|nr:hypothetical protein JI735_01575 [Paenibacillus sonchi]